MSRIILLCWTASVAFAGIIMHCEFARGAGRQTVIASTNQSVTLDCPSKMPYVSKCVWSRSNRKSFGFNFINPDPNSQCNYCVYQNITRCLITISKVKEEDYGIWNCRTGNASLGTRYMGKVFVMSKPEAPKLLPSTLDFVYDERRVNEISLTCFSLNGRPPPDFVWFYGNERLNKGLSPVVTNINNGISNTSQQLLIQKLKWTDTGVSIKCIIAHETLTEKDTKEVIGGVNVLFSPRSPEGELGKFMRLQTEVGMEMVFSVNVSANPQPSKIVWKIHGETLENEDRKYGNQSVENIEGTLFQINLRIYSVTKEDFLHPILLRVTNDIGDVEFYFILKPNGTIYFHSCDENEFRCNTGRCFDKSIRCNEINECGDYSDEMGCNIGTAKEVEKSAEYSLSIMAIVFVVVSVIGTCGFILKRRCTVKSILSQHELNSFFSGNDNSVEKDSAYKVPYDKDRYEIPNGAFRLDREGSLGSGEFGWVCKGKINADSQETTVAVKMANPQKICKSTINGLLSEIKVLAYIGKHKNVTELFRANTSEVRIGKVFIFLEFCQYGSLENYLRKLRPLNISRPAGASRFHSSPTNGNNEITMEMKIFPENHLSHAVLHDLYRWSAEICDGMSFLATEHVVHADLATRNVLLGTNKEAKIVDFGLSRRMYSYESYVKKQQEPLPWKWMAPESLRVQEFNEKTDVWAYGVTLWEIYSLGDRPYQGLSWDLNFTQILTSGFRLEEPEFNDNDMYTVMRACWELNPHFRPSFEELKSTKFAL